MKRRDFIRLTAASAGASLIVPTISWAEEAKPVSPSQDIYYTKEASGRWAGKAATHVPVIEVTKAEGSATVNNSINGSRALVLKFLCYMRMPMLLM